MKQEDHVTFTINQVAKILGVVPATIRNWEKNKLITVKRSPSNYRIFTPDDIETLKKIRDYSVGKHMGVQAIKMLLPAGDRSDIGAYVDQKQEVCYSKKLMSEKWREIRKNQGYTLDEVSKATGISATHLSNLENGGNVSLDFLNKLASFYRESPMYFMEPDIQENHLVRKDCGEPILLRNDPGLEITYLSAMRDHIMYPAMYVVEPGCGNLLRHSHNGEELIYMISGVLEVCLNEDPPYILHPGDTFHYRGSDIHCWKNISSKKAKLLWVHSILSK